MAPGETRETGTGGDGGHVVGRERERETRGKHLRGQCAVKRLSAMPSWSTSKSKGTPAPCDSVSPRNEQHWRRGDSVMSSPQTPPKVNCQLRFHREDMSVSALGRGPFPIQEKTSSIHYKEFLVSLGGQVALLMLEQLEKTETEPPVFQLIKSLPEVNIWWWILKTDFLKKI